MNKSLVIIQDVPTQFDVPLYNQIADKALFSLLVIYTQVATDDVEIGRMPQWDHIQEHRYQHHFLSNDERNNFKKVGDIIFNVSPNHVIISGYWPKLHRDIMRLVNKQGISVGLRSDNTIRHTQLSGIRGFIKRAYLKRLLRQYSIWHPVGQQAADYLTYLSGESKTISFFPYSTDNNWFHEQTRIGVVDRVNCLARIGFPTNCYVILAVIKWSEREDPMTLLRAFEQYQLYNKNARLVLVGDGPLRQQVNNFITKHQNLIHTPGYVSYSRLPYWYNLADVFVHPAPNEPWGVSVTEALASGVPVIASTGVGAAVELLSEGENGYIFEQCNVNSLVNILKKWQVINESRAATDIVKSCQAALNSCNYETTIENFQRILNNA